MIVWQYGKRKAVPDSLSDPPRDPPELLGIEATMGLGFNFVGLTICTLVLGLLLMEYLVVAVHRIHTSICSHHTDN